MLYALTNRTHGKQIGHFGGSINNLSAGGIMHLLYFSMSYAGPLTFENFYGESLWRLGDVLASSSNELALTFHSGLFGFHLQTDERGVPASMLGAIGTYSPVVFRGCHFSDFPSVLALVVPGVLLDECSIDPADRRVGTVAEYVALAHNALAGGAVFNTIIQVGGPHRHHNIKFKAVTLSNLTVGSAIQCGDDSEFQQSRILHPGTRTNGGPENRKIPRHDPDASRLGRGGKKLIVGLYPD